MTSHLLPAYARVDLAFERGEGVWLIATNGERYLDFASGRGGQRARPCASARGRGDHRAGPARLIHVSNLYRIPRGRAAGRPAVRGKLRRHGVFRQFRRRGDGSASSRSCASTSRRTAIPSASASSPSRARSTAARSRRSRRPRTRSISTASARSMDGFDQVPLGDIEAVKRAIRPGDRRHPDRAGAGRGRRPRARRRSSSGRCASFATSAACCWRSTRCRPASAGSARCSATRRLGVTPDVMALAKGLGAGFPIGAVPGHRRGRQGHDRRHPRLDLRRQSAGDGGRQCRARRGDGKPGFLDHVRQIALLFRQRLAEIKDRHPTVIAEVRGEGLLIGLRSAWFRTANWSMRCRAEKLLDGRRRRQCRAAGAAADRQRGGGRRGDRRGSTAPAPQSSARSQRGRRREPAG